MKQGVTKDGKGVVLHSIGLSRMELRIFYKEQVAFYLHLGLTNVQVEAKNAVSETFLKRWGNGGELICSVDDGGVKEYGEIAGFVRGLVERRRCCVVCWRKEVCFYTEELTIIRVI